MSGADDERLSGSRGGASCWLVKGWAHLLSWCGADLEQLCLGEARLRSSGGEIARGFTTD